MGVELLKAVTRARACVGDMALAELAVRRRSGGGTFGCSFLRTFCRCCLMALPVVRESKLSATAS